MKSLPRTRFMSPTARAKKQENGVSRVYPSRFFISLHTRYQLIALDRIEQQALLVHEGIPARGIEERMLPTRSPGVRKQDLTCFQRSALPADRGGGPSTCERKHAPII